MLYTWGWIRPQSSAASFRTSLNSNSQNVLKINITGKLKKSDSICIAESFRRLCLWISLFKRRAVTESWSMALISRQSEIKQKPKLCYKLTTRTKKFPHRTLIDVSWKWSIYWFFIILMKKNNPTQPRRNKRTGKTEYCSVQYKNNPTIYAQKCETKILSAVIYWNPHQNIWMSNKKIILIPYSRSSKS